MSAIDMTKVIKELCPNSLRQLTEEAELRREVKGIVKVLQARFEGVPNQQIERKLERFTTIEALDVMLQGAARMKTLDEFLRLL